MDYETLSKLPWVIKLGEEKIGVLCGGGVKQGESEVQILFIFAMQETSKKLQ